MRQQTRISNVVHTSFSCGEMCKDANDSANVDFSFAAVTRDYSVNPNRWTEIDTEPRITQRPKGTGVTH